MPVTMTLVNLTNRPVLARGNSGMTFHLPPNGKIENIHEVEVNNNERIKKLEEARIIAVRKAAGEKAAPAASDVAREKASHDITDSAKREREKAESTTKHKK